MLHVKQKWRVGAMERREVLLPVRLSTEESELLKRRAKAFGISQGDHLRSCMVVEAVMGGDLAALKLVGKAMSERLAKTLDDLRRAGALTL
jgi:hypothetical protein